MSITKYIKIDKKKSDGWFSVHSIVVSLSSYISLNTGKLMVDFVPDIHIEDVKRILFHYKDQHAVHFFLCSISFTH